MFRRIYRQRRHAYIATILVLFGILLKAQAEAPGALAYIFGPDWQTFLILSVSVITLALIFMVAAALFCAVFPLFSALPEQIGLLVLLSGIIATVWPETYEPQILRSFLPYIFMLSLIPLVYTDSFKRLPGWVNYSAKRHFRSSKSAEQLWEKLVIEDDGMELSIIDEITPTDDPNMRQVRFKIGNGLFAIRTEEVIRSEKPFHHAYRFEGMGSAQNKARTSGIATIEIKPRPKGGCDVCISETREFLPFSMGFYLWSNDSTGSYADHLSANDKDRRDWSLDGQTRRKILATS